MRTGRIGLDLPGRPSCDPPSGPLHPSHPIRSVQKITASIALSIFRRAHYRQHVPSRPPHHIIRQPTHPTLLNIHLNHHRPTPLSQRRQPCRRVHHRGSPTHQEHLRFPCRCLRTSPNVRRQPLPEPNHPRPQRSPTLRAQRRQRRQRSPPIHPRNPTSQAPDVPNIPMDLQHVPAPRQIMQTIHILSNQGERRNTRLKRDQGTMSRIRRSIGNQAATPVVPLPDQLRVASERLWSRQILGPELAPESGRAAEVGIPPSADTPAPVSTATERAPPRIFRTSSITSKDYGVAPSATK